MSSPPPPPSSGQPPPGGPPPPPSTKGEAAPPPSPKGQPPSGQPPKPPTGQPPAGQPPAGQPPKPDTGRTGPRRSQPPPPEWFQAQQDSVSRASVHKAMAQAAQPAGHPGPGQQQAWAQYQPYTPQYVTEHAQANPTPRPRLRTWLLGGVVAVCSTFLALAFALFFGLSFGVVATLLGLVFALIPLFIVLPIFLWLDRFEAEPWRYLLTAFLYGALGSTFLAIIANTIGGLVLMGITDPESASVLSAVLIAPLTEETFKGAFILIMWWFMRREFNGLTDGIVYAGIVAAGFAFTENILYLARALTESGGVAFAVTWFMRGIVSPFLHPMFTTMTGIGIGIAATSRSVPVKFAAPFLGWCAAMLLHGLWNLSASAGWKGFLIGLVCGAIAFVCFVGFVVWTRSREARIIGQHLRPYADTGWLSLAEVSMLASMKQRRHARRWARLSGGPVSVKSMRAFQDTASELALLRFRMLTHAADEAALRNERVLLDSMTARRREFAGSTAG